MASQNDVEIRRRPEQARSRARVQMILKVTADLVGQHGADAVSMTDIASKAKMSKAALYRYFPNRQSVIRELALTEFSIHRNNINAASADDSRDARTIMEHGLRSYCEMHRAEPYRVQLRAAIHADARLSALDLADSRENARLMADLITTREPSVKRDGLPFRILLVIELLDGLIRAITRVESAEADAMIEEFTSMAIRQIFDTTHGTDE